VSICLANGDREIYLSVADLLIYYEWQQNVFTAQQANVYATVVGLTELLFFVF